MRAVPRLCGFYPGICLTNEEKARKNLSQGRHKKLIVALYNFANSPNESKRNELWICFTMNCWWQHLGLRLDRGNLEPTMVKGEASEMRTTASWGKLAGDLFRRRSSTFSHSPEVNMRCFYCWNENHFDVTKTKPLLQTLTPTSCSCSEPPHSLTWKFSGKEFAL